jgi:hypothetical protein
MELRQLTTEIERRTFARRLSEVRMMRGAGFSETQRSLIGEVHLTFGKLYGLYDDSALIPEMIGGFAIHNLDMFSQSYAKPDLTHLPPESVIEGGELWAIAAGAGPILRDAGVILGGILEAKALLVYPIVKPWNLSGGFKYYGRVGEPIEWPYARTLDGGKIFVQSMVLEGDALAAAIADVGQYGFEMLDGGRRLHFNTPFNISGKRFTARRRAGDLSIPHILPAIEHKLDAA